MSPTLLQQTLDAKLHVPDTAHVASSTWSGLPVMSYTMISHSSKWGSRSSLLLYYRKNKKITNILQDMYILKGHSPPLTVSGPDQKLFCNHFWINTFRWKTAFPARVHSMWTPHLLRWYYAKVFYVLQRQCLKSMSNLRQDLL